METKEQDPGLNPNQLNSVDALAHELEGARQYLNDAIQLTNSEEYNSAINDQMVGTKVLKAITQIVEANNTVLKSVEREPFVSPSAKFRTMAMHCDQLSIGRQMSVLVSEAERENVELLRSLGATWDEIGGSLGTSKQSAQSKFGRKKPAQKDV